MPWPTAEEIGNIVARLAIADSDFLAYLLQAAEKAGDKMLPEDVEKLEGWARFMRILSGSINKGVNKK